MAVKLGCALMLDTIEMGNHSFSASFIKGLKARTRSLYNGGNLLLRRKGTVPICLLVNKKTNPYF